MCYFLLDYQRVIPTPVHNRSILNIRLLYQWTEAEVPRHHKEKRYTKTADGLHRNARDSRKFAVHEHHEHTGNAFEKVQAIVILFLYIHHEVIP